MAVAVSSAAGLLALLEEEDDALKTHALVNLDKVVHEFWYQISASIASVEALYEDEAFQRRELASLVASKVFYHLGELDSALHYALGAGALFDITERSEYVQTLVSRCLDTYFALRVKEVEKKEEVTVDPRLVAVVERMLATCCEHGQFEQAVGVALESRRLDKLEQVIAASSDEPKTIAYALGVARQLITSRTFRDQVLRLLIKAYEGVASPDWPEVCQCLMVLDDHEEVANILDRLLRGSQDDCLLAFQIGFDLVENELQSFLARVQAHLDSRRAGAASFASVAGTAAAAADGAAAASGDVAMETEADGAGALTGTALAARQVALKDILSGKTPIGLYLEFLYRNNKADVQILKNIKAAVDPRNSVAHGAVILANALQHAGTTVDVFLRDNLEWLARATNWAKFSATAGLGVIHRGQLAQSRTLMAPYLPRPGGAGSAYSEGGALYALGLIHANAGADVTTFLLEALRGASGEVVQHGGCLGLGLAALGSCDEAAFEEVKAVLYTDSAVAGEAAGLAAGLLFAGSGTDKAAELLAYAHDTQHEKIIRGIAIGLAITAYGREEGAEGLIEQMSRDADPILRYGAMYVIGLAYRGTGNNGAIQKLLHYAVGDVSDDVRRAAITNLGFVLMNSPEQCPRIVALLAESFNPHMRYGAAMAVGLACAGSGNKDAILLLEPMLGDGVDYVRQGALIAMALVLLQQPESRVEPFRKRLTKFIEDRHEEVMCKMGAIMAAGIIDAGGRNVTVGLRSRSGYFRRTSLIGLALFTQYWYWYPLSYTLSLALTPSAVIGLNGDLKMPKAQLVSNCRPSTFAYAPPVTEQKKTAAAEVAKAILSTTAKARDRAKKKAEAKAGGKPETGAAGPSAGVKPAGDGPSAMETDAAPGKEGGAAAAGADAAAAAATAKKDEPTSFTMENPARVVPAQVRHVQFPAESRWQPIKTDAATTGIILLRDLQPGEPVELVATAGAAAPAAAAGAAAPAAAAPAATAPAAAAAAAEPPPPAPFEYTD